MHQSQIDTPGELLRERRGRRSRIAGKRGRFLDFGERDDLDSAGDGAGEGIERGVEGAAEGGGDNVGYFLGGGKALGEGCALGFSELGEERVRQSVVGGAEVVETLCVADEVEGYGHFGVW